MPQFVPTRYLGNGTQTVRDLGKAEALAWRQHHGPFPDKLWCHVSHGRQHASGTALKAMIGITMALNEASVITSPKLFFYCDAFLTW